jgi:NifU-like protein involved in Fe-S cluster formation
MRLIEIASAEELISFVKGITLDSINSIIDSAKEALESENPVEAIKIASSVPGHLESLESTDYRG